MKKKGFTLIELLAVIVILAIIALIITPIVSDLIESARKAAFKDSVLGVIESTNNYTSEYVLEHKNDIVYPVTFTCDGISCKNGDDILTFKGPVPKSGTIILNETGVLAVNVTDGKYCANGYKWNLTVENSCSGEDGENDPTDPNPNPDPTDPNPSNPNPDPTVPDPGDLTPDGIYEENNLNGAVPRITGDLIPVVIEDDGTVKKADLTTKWYNYREKKWANAVILDDTRITYNVGEVIPEDNIATYFVWIPRYKYKLFNMGEYSTYSGTEKPATINVSNIEIVFESKTTPVSNGNAVGEYLTHPAFTAFDVNGMWVGKFETVDYLASSGTVRIKPNRVAVSCNINSCFTAMYNYRRLDLNSHMMKNTEWGAVAYLSLSVYGINGEVRVNNSSKYNTGCAASTPGGASYNGCENAYNTPIGYLASTTGNITGIYDMSGGAAEHVAAYVSGRPYGGASGITPTNYDAKYFDVYDASSSINSYNNRILGDATGEVGPFYYYKDSDNVQRYHNNWYQDQAYFVEATNPWFNRGSSYNGKDMAGQLAFHKSQGAGTSHQTARLVLSPLR